MALGSAAFKMKLLRVKKIIVISISDSVLDPGAWKCPKLTNKPGFLTFQMAFVGTLVGLFFDPLPTYFL